MALRRELLEIPSRITESELWDLVGEVETGTVDFKEQLPKPGKLQEPLTAFANHRGGIVAIGISSTLPYRVIGTDWTQRHEERVQESARATQPPMRVEVSTSRVGQRTVAFIQVEGLDRGWVHTSDGRVLVRSGPTNRALVGTELLRFLRERAAEPVEDEPATGATLQALDSSLVRRYLQVRLPRRRMRIADAMRDLGWADEAGRLRLAADLVFGKRPQERNRRFGIELLRFEGSVSGGAELRERKELDGPLPALIESADQLIYEEMRRDAVVRGLVREEVPEFPPVVVREAVVNAVGHRDYSLRGAAVQIRLYDDALEVESPGTLPGYVTVDTLREAQYSRNERIMDALQRLGFVEEAGQGIDRMFREMEDALLDPPQFEEREASFVVRLRGTSVFAAEDRLWVAELADLDLSADAKIAVVYARRHGAISNEDLRRLRGLDRDASRATLQDLVARGLLQAVGRGRGARYVLGALAERAGRARTLDEELRVILNHARRKGSVVNADVRGLLGVDRVTARQHLSELVARGLLRPEGERRGRRYLPA
jgi:ATP-dependent DNA helicase RecG